ncbi:membrane fusion protein, multidrug efflux system [Roseivivax halotolerans]|uniref:Membrane fusion protein, multidrug efflux system n=1 Tax=Roseivivax halotolerans TaxID=93684 RepID=A0A1I5Y827_9RHOB|nr:membrane fusion protein, multidrug efflux system [Roseivivax halotolerans]
MKRLFKIIGGLCVAGLCAAAGIFGTEYFLSSQSSASQSSQQGGQSATPVGVAQPERRELETAVSAVGTIMPLRDVELTPAAAGRVTEVAAGSGAQLQEGELVLQLDDRAQQAAVSSAEATFDEASQNLARVEELAEANTAAERQLEQARATFARAEGELMSARAALEDRRITAPFSGTLGLMDVDEGAYLSTSSVVARLSDLSVVQVDISLPERYFERVAPGQMIEATVPAYPDSVFEGEVVVRDSTVQPGSRSFDVRAEITNTDRRLVGGMFAETRLVFDTYEGLALPDDAIISEGSSTYVFTVADSTATRTDISLGGSVGSLTEVTDGIEENDQVVVAGWGNLRDGASVTISEDVPEEALE